MKVNEIMKLLPENQEVQIHYKDLGYCASMVGGFRYGLDALLNSEIE